MISIDEQIALLPCPFCNKPDTAKVSSSFDLYDDDQGNGECWAVFCDASNPNGRGGCGASGGFKPAQGEAIDAWNKRATLQSIKDAGDDVVEPEYLIRLRNALKGFKSDGAFAGDKDIVDYIDSLQSALQVAQQDRDNCYASLDNVRRRLHEIETFVTGDANEYRINKKLKDDEKSIKSLIEHLLAMADNYHTVNQLYIQAKDRAEKAEAIISKCCEVFDCKPSDLLLSIKKAESERDEFRNVLIAVKETLKTANEMNNGPIVDTIWHTPTETLFDFIDAAIDIARNK